MPFFLLFLQTEGGKPAHPGHKAPQTVLEDKRPVTAREAAQTFDRVANLFGKVNGVSLGISSVPAEGRPATRSEIVTEMDRIVRAATPTIRFTPVPIKHDPSVFRIDLRQRTALDRLVTMGYVARIGPLAVGPSAGLTPKEFGDAVGLFIARLAQVSHMPSPKWTPFLQGN